jgi:23S rRNA (cytosine1962-C5)-methyltransferase
VKEKKAILKPGKDKAIRHRHHWIFSGAIRSFPDIDDGDFAPVYSSEGLFLGTAYFNRRSQIAGRMVAFDDTPPLRAIQNHLDQAIAWRKEQFSGQMTNAYRFVNGEGDLIPGLVVDKYDDALVIQISTLGIDRLRSWMIDYLVKTLSPRCIYEKSPLSSRREEGLGEAFGLLYGSEIPHEGLILENGLKFLVSIVEGQKTGFFLDHREMRQLILTFARGRSVLNCFSYTGGFSIYAAAGGANRVV